MANGQKQETRQESGHKILDICLDVLEGRKGKEELREAMEMARQDLVMMQQDFEDTVAEQPQNIQQACQKEIDYTNENFSAYHQAFDTIEVYFKTGDIFDIVRGAEKVRGASAALNNGFMDFRNRALVAMGPTDIPILNLVLDTYKKLEEASQEEKPAFTEKLLTVISREHLAAQRVLIDFKRAPAGSMLPEEELLKSAYEEHQSACVLIRENLMTFNQENLDKGIEMYQNAATRIRDLIPAANVKRLTQMPTISPQANLVINLGKMLLGENSREEMFLDALKTLEESFNDTKMQFDAIKRSPADSVLVREEMENAVKAIAAYENALNDFYRFVEVREAILLAQASSKLEEAVKLMNQSGEAFMSIAEREGKVPCIRCSHFNPPERKTCEKCGAVLPVPAESQPARTFEMGEQDEVQQQSEEIVLTENIHRLFDAVNKVSEGQIPVEEFQQVVDWMEEIVNIHKTAYGPLPPVNIENIKPDLQDPAKKVKEMIEEANEVFKEGADDIITGIGFFRQYISNGDKNNLVAGVQIIWQGVGKLQIVQKATGLIKAAQDEAQQK